MNDGEQLMFAARESAQLGAGSADGLTWPVVVMRAGFARGEVMTGDPQLAGLPHYFPRDVVAQVAEAAKDARFGRHHPQTEAEETDPARIAGWLDAGTMQGDEARATMHLYENEKDLQAKLLAARRAGKLGQFGTSILACFAWNKGMAEGRPALVAQRLARLISVDMVTEAGAGGKFLSYAASLRATDAKFEGGKMQRRGKGAVRRSWIECGLNGEDKLQFAMDVMCGVKEAMGQGLRGFESLQDAYKQVTGAPLSEHFTRGGGFYAKTAEAIAMSNFPEILLNSMTKRLEQDYGEFSLVPGLEKIYVKSDFSDFKPQDRVRMGYLTDLPQVSEAAAFASLRRLQTTKSPMW